MLHHELKHIVDGKFKLQWHWTLKQGSTTEYEWKYYLYYNSKIDIEEFLERYVKPTWPDVKWEIVDVHTV